MMTADGIDASLRTDGDFFYGWRVLHLEALQHRRTRDEEHESRTIYANWGNKQQPQLAVAVLRAVQSSRSQIRSLLDQPGQSEQDILVSGRHVWVPMQRAREWVSAFSQLRVPVGELETTNSTEHIRHLRVDLNWISRVFEKRWEPSSADHDELNTLWELVWKQMTDALRTAASIGDATTLEETFPRREAPHPFHYDRGAYDPERMVHVMSDRGGRVRGA